MIPHPPPSLPARSSLAAGAACLIGVLALLGGATTGAASTSSPDPAPTATFARPADGAHIAGVVAVAMVADGVDIEPAGEAHAGAGHFHIMIDDGCVEPGDGIPRDDAHLHFGQGQTEAQLYLGPGTHALCLQVGDGIHTAQAITDQISIEVGVESIEEFCTVATQLDELTDNRMEVSADMSADEFAAAQQVSADALHLVDQLRDASRWCPTPFAATSTPPAPHWRRSPASSPRPRTLTPPCRSWTRTISGRPMATPSCGPRGGSRAPARSS